MSEIQANAHANAQANAQASSPECPRISPQTKHRTRRQTNARPQTRHQTNARPQTRPPARPQTRPPARPQTRPSINWPSARPQSKPILTHQPVTACQPWSVSNEINQYNITQKILYLVPQTNKRKYYEYLNCIERWIIAMINEKHPLFHDASENKNIIKIYKGVYSKVSRDSPCSKKLLKELSDKKIGTPTSKLFNYILDTVNIRLARKRSVYPVQSLQYRGEHVTIKIGNQLRINSIVLKLGREKIAELSRYDSHHVVLPMILRYETMVSGGQQWSLPAAQYDYLYTNYDVRFEGFASPLNSGLSGKKDAKFCSLFAEDDIFGSIGNFFDQTLYEEQDLLSLKSVEAAIDDVLHETTEDTINVAYEKKENAKRHWVVNPPFVEDIMIRVVDKIIHDLDYAADHGLEVMALMIMPTWTDFAGYKKMFRSKHLKSMHAMTSGNHYYEHNGMRKVVRSKSTAFVLDTYNGMKLMDYTEIMDKMIINM